MVKNISNPLNARKIGTILSDDADSQGYQTSERDISVFLSDHRFNGLKTALNQMRQEDILPEEYQLSKIAEKQLIDNDFLDASSSLSSKKDHKDSIDFLKDVDPTSIEFKTQLDSLKNKVMSAWAGGVSIEGKELDNFDRKFGRPMESFRKQLKQNRGIEISDLQAFAVVYATDQLALANNSKDEVYYLMFGRFDDIKDELSEEFDIDYSWPVVSGTSFIDMGKKFCVGPELAEFGRRFKNISGLDTYPDEVIQMVFYELISGELTSKLVKKNILYRWADDSSIISDPHKWLLPPMDYSIDRNQQQLLLYAVIAHTLLYKIDPEGHELITILRELKDVSNEDRPGYLAKKLEASLTRKSVSLQFGTTLANFFENFKTNPEKVTPFHDTTYRYYTKIEDITTLFTTLRHSIRSGLKNSTGILRRYLKDISETDLDQTIRSKVSEAIDIALDQHGYESGLSMSEIDDLLMMKSEEEIKSFFKTILGSSFKLINQYSKDLEPKQEQPKSKEGGMKELTSDFLSTIEYHGNKSEINREMINRLIDENIPENIAKLIVHVSNYMTFRVVGKEGETGKNQHRSIVNYFKNKYRDLRSISLADNTTLKEKQVLTDFLTRDLTQAHALMNIASKLQVDAYNAWTPLEQLSEKNSVYINQFILPNLLYWQRLPKEFINQLLSKELINKEQVKTLVNKTGRLSLLEAYSLIVMSVISDIASFNEANDYIREVFDIDGDLVKAFKINPKQGEAEIAQEITHLWMSLQEESS